MSFSFSLFILLSVAPRAISIAIGNRSLANLVPRHVPLWRRRMPHLVSILRHRGGVGNIAPPPMHQWRCLGYLGRYNEGGELHEGSASSVASSMARFLSFPLTLSQTRQLRSRGTRDPTAARVICLVPLPCGIGTPLFYPIPCPKTSGISKFAGWRKHWPEHPQTLENRSDLNSNVNERAQRSRAFPCAAKMAAFPVSGGGQCGRNKLRPSRVSDEKAALGVPQTFPLRLAAEDAPPGWRRSWSTPCARCTRARWIF